MGLGFANSYTKKHQGRLRVRAGACKGIINS